MDREVHLNPASGAVDDDEWEYALWRRHLFMGIGSLPSVPYSSWATCC